jgi:hypothetical protein
MNRTHESFTRIGGLPAVWRRRLRGASRVGIARAPRRRGASLLPAQRRDQRVRRRGKATFFPQTDVPGRAAEKSRMWPTAFSPTWPSSTMFIRCSRRRFITSRIRSECRPCSADDPASRMFGRHHLLPRQRRPSSREGIPGSIGDSKTARMRNFKKLECAVDRKKSDTSFSGDKRHAAEMKALLDGFESGHRFAISIESLAAASLGTSPATQSLRSNCVMQNNCPLRADVLQTS